MAAATPSGTGQLAVVGGRETLDCDWLCHDLGGVGEGLGAGNNGRSRQRALADESIPDLTGISF